MKIIRLLLFALLIPFSSIGQTLEASYHVIENIFVNSESGEKKIGTLESTGHLYRKDGRYLYFETPNYLGQYPDGKITLDVSANGSHTVSLCLDSVQRVSFKNMDSLFRYYRPHITGKDEVKFNYKQKFDADFYEWEMMTETKNINGLKCQKATLKIRDNLQWVVWFAPEVPMQAGLSNIIGLPGLVVEAECVPLKIYYTLNTFSIGKEIPESIFHPKEFDQPFEIMPDLKKSNKQPEKSKIQKQAELTNQ